MVENNPKRPSSNWPLTAREVEIVQLLVEGLSNPEIAARLSLSPRTVQSHVASALAKTGARSRTHLAVIAIRTGVVPSDPATADDEPCSS